MANTIYKAGITGAAMSSTKHKAYGGRVSKGIAARASHRTVRDTLASYGSCHSTIIR